MKRKPAFPMTGRPLPPPLQEAPEHHLVWYFLHHPFRQSYAFQGALQLIIEAPSSQCLYIALENGRKLDWIARELNALRTIHPPPEYHVTACRHTYMELLELKARNNGPSWPVWTDEFDDADPVYSCLESLGRYFHQHPPELADGIPALNAMCSEWKAGHNACAERQKERELADT